MSSDSIEMWSVQKGKTQYNVWHGSYKLNYLGRHGWVSCLVHRKLARWRVTRNLREKFTTESYLNYQSASCVIVL
jgi:hypothetical protein